MISILSILLTICYFVSISVQLNLFVLHHFRWNRHNLTQFVNVYLNTIIGCSTVILCYHYPHTRWLLPIVMLDLMVLYIRSSGIDQYRYKHVLPQLILFTACLLSTLNQIMFSSLLNPFSIWVYWWMLLLIVFLFVRMSFV